MISWCDLRHRPDGVDLQVFVCHCPEPSRVGDSAFLAAHAHQRRTSSNKAFLLFVHTRRIEATTICEYRPSTYPHVMRKNAQARAFFCGEIGIETPLLWVEVTWTVPHVGVAMVTTSLAHPIQRRKMARMELAERADT
jgi:hypothetical protein